MHQKHSAELRRCPPGLRLHAGHVRPAGTCLGRDTERGGCVLVLRRADAKDVVLQFANRHRYGLSAGLLLHYTLHCMMKWQELLQRLFTVLEYVSAVDVSCQ